MSCSEWSCVGVQRTGQAVRYRRAELLSHRASSFLGIRPRRRRSLGALKDGNGDAGKAARLVAPERANGLVRRASAHDRESVTRLRREREQVRDVKNLGSIWIVVSLAGFPCPNEFSTAL